MIYHLNFLKLLVLFDSDILNIENSGLQIFMNRKQLRLFLIYRWATRPYNAVPYNARVATLTRLSFELLKKVAAEIIQEIPGIVSVT